MKKQLLLALFAALTLAATAQTDYDYMELTRGILKVEKKAAIAEVMQLSESETVAFWDLYNEFDAKLYQIQNKRIAIVKDYAKNYDAMTDAKANELWLATIKYKDELLKLRKTYYKKFSKILPATKAVQLMQMDNKIETLIDAQLAIEIPLVQPK